MLLLKYIANEVKGGASEVELADASEFENGGTALLQTQMEVKHLLGKVNKVTS